MTDLLAEDAGRPESWRLGFVASSPDRIDPNDGSTTPGQFSSSYIPTGDLTLPQGIGRRVEFATVIRSPYGTWRATLHTTNGGVMPSDGEYAAAAIDTLIDLAAQVAEQMRTGA